MRTTLLLALAFAAATFAKTAPARADADEPAPLARVLMKVYADGWMTVEDLTFFSDGRYRRVTYDLGTKRAARPKVGTLTAGHLKALSDKVAHSGQFKHVDGVATYEFGIDDTKTPDPAKVRALVFDILKG